MEYCPVLSEVLLLVLPEPVPSSFCHPTPAQ